MSATPTAPASPEIEPLAAPPAPAPVYDGYGTQGRPEWLDIDWQQHLRSVTVHGSRVNYIEIGEGPPLVLVHGISACWQNWLENIPHFARTHRVIAVDLLGFGESELPQEEISIPGYGRFVDAFLGEIGVERAALVGSSMGGFISAETAIAHPSRVEKLVLVNAAGGPTLNDLQQRWGRSLLRGAKLFHVVAARAVARRKEIVRRPKLRRRLLFKIVRHPELIGPELCYEVASGGGKPGFFDAFKAIVEYEYCERLDDIPCPTLIVWGDHDEIVPVQDADEYERLIPHARKVIFDDTGHLPMIERPALFNRVLEEFLAE